jgi:hypothetical protein
MEVVMPSRHHILYFSSHLALELIADAYLLFCYILGALSLSQRSPGQRRAGILMTILVRVQYSRIAMKAASGGPKGLKHRRRQKNATVGWYRLPALHGTVRDGA